MSKSKDDFKSLVRAPAHTQLLAFSTMNDLCEPLMGVLFGHGD
jgi:hypothetical protein